LVADYGTGQLGKRGETKKTEPYPERGRYDWGEIHSGTHQGEKNPCKAEGSKKKKKKKRRDRGRKGVVDGKIPPKDLRASGGHEEPVPTGSLLSKTVRTGGGRGSLLDATGRWGGGKW